MVKSSPKFLDIFFSLSGQATCQVAGDPHYFTFDGLMYTFVGTCTYTLVEVISESVENITILGKNEDRGLRGATYLKEVYIDLYGVRITLQKSKGILVGGSTLYTARSILKLAHYSSCRKKDLHVS